MLKYLERPTTPWEHLAAAVATVRQLARPRGDNYYELLLNRWRTIRRFLPVLLGTINFGATEAGQTILEALHFLKKIEGRSRASMDAAPLDIVNSSWQQLVMDSEGLVDQRAYTFCVLERLKDGLRRRDLFVSLNLRWGDPRTKLFQGAAWESARSSVCRVLGRAPTAETEL